MPGRNRFPRQERITRRSDYLALYGEGEKRVGRQFVCFVARREGQGRKLGLAVSRKVGGAVVRNRVKRYIREVYRTHREQIAEGVQMVIVARPSAARLGYFDCENAICRLLESGKVLNA